MYKSIILVNHFALSDTQAITGLGLTLILLT